MLHQPNPSSWLSRMLRATFRLRCPACGRGRLFERGFSLLPTCPACGARYEREPGEWTGPVVISYSLGAGLAFLFWVVLFATDRLFAGAEILSVVLAVVIALGSYRPAKGWWIWLIHEAGLVYPDERAS